MPFVLSLCFLYFLFCLCIQFTVNVMNVLCTPMPRTPPFLLPKVLTNTRNVRRTFFVLFFSSSTNSPRVDLFKRFVARPPQAALVFTRCTHHHICVSQPPPLRSVGVRLATTVRHVRPPYRRPLLVHPLQVLFCTTPPLLAHPKIEGSSNCSFFSLFSSSSPELKRLF